LLLLLCMVVLASAVWGYRRFAASSPGTGSGAAFLNNPAEYKTFQLVAKKNITHNSVRFRFSLGDAKKRLGLPIGRHIFLRFGSGANAVSRPYTPISSDEDVGAVDLLIKVYKDGKMSQHLNSLSVGGSMEVRGPIGALTYDGAGQFTVRTKSGKVVQRKFVHVGMVAGGTGITPMYQLLQHLLRQQQRGRGVEFDSSLVFGNVSVDDILLRDELDAAAKALGKHFHLHYTIDRAPADDSASSWKYSVGYITQAMIHQHMPAPADGVLILVCGPKIMCDNVERYLKALNYPDDQVFFY